MTGLKINGAIRKRKKKTNTNKIVGRLTYSPQKHKQQYTRRLRKDIQSKTHTLSAPATPPVTIKFGSININGLDMEAGWAIEQLITKKKLDVSKQSLKITNC